MPAPSMAPQFWMVDAPPENWVGLLDVVSDGGLMEVFVAAEPELVVMLTEPEPERAEEELTGLDELVTVPLPLNEREVVVTTLLVEQDIVVEVRIVVVTVVALVYELEPVPTIEEEVEVGAEELETPVVQPGRVKKGPNSLCTMQAFSQAPSPAVVELS